MVVNLLSERFERGNEATNLLLTDLQGPADALARNALDAFCVEQVFERHSRFTRYIHIEMLERHRLNEVRAAGVDELFPPQETHTVLGRSDYVVVACPLIESTQNIIGLLEFASMKHDRALINIGRGPVVN